MRRRDFVEIWATGTGRFGSVSECRGLLTVIYFETHQEAEERQGWLDRIGCGKDCSRQHLTWDLVARLVMSLAILGTAIAVVTETVKLSRALDRT